MYVFIKLGDKKKKKKKVKKIRGDHNNIIMLNSYYIFIEISIFSI